MRRTPLLPPALALVAGIVAACHVGWTPAAWLWALAACTLITGIFLLLHKRLHSLVIIPVLLLCAAAGGLLASLQLQHDWTRDCPENAFLEARLTETPMPRERSWRAKAEVTNVNHRPATGPVTLYLRKDSTAATLRYGDRLLLHVYPDTEQRQCYTTSDHYLVAGRDSTSFRARCENLRIKLLHRMQAGPLAKREAGVAEALTLGWRGDLDPTTQASYRDAGIAHLLAVSGLHVGLLATLVGGLLIWTGNKRRGRTARGVVQLMAVWSFAVLTGWAPATVRAALMFSLFIVANISGRRTPKLNLLAIAAIITLTDNPLLIHDAGWLLSYSAVAGILLARPVIMAYRSRLWQAAAVSVSATLATLPVTVAVFHRLPLYFLIANTVIIPLSGLMLFFAMLYMAVPCGATAWPVSLAVRATEDITSWVAALPGAVADGIFFPSWGIAVLAATVLVLFLCARTARDYQNDTYF